MQLYGLVLVGRDLTGANVRQISLLWPLINCLTDRKDIDGDVGLLSELIELKAASSKIRLEVLLKGGLDLHLVGALHYLAWLHAALWLAEVDQLRSQLAVQWSDHVVLTPNTCDLGIVNSESIIRNLISWELVFKTGGIQGEAAWVDYLRLASKSAAVSDLMLHCGWLV